MAFKVSGDISRARINFFLALISNERYFLFATFTSRAIVMLSYYMYSRNMYIFFGIARIVL